MRCLVLKNTFTGSMRKRKKGKVFQTPIPYKKRERKSIYELPYEQEARTAALERAAREIYDKKLPGNTAEVGVYRGSFAQHINWWFFDKKLYLADTFEGFDQKDVLVEKKFHYSAGTQEWNDTSAEYVLSRMPNPQNCVIRKGWFPKVMEDVTDLFCFVSLDTDLYEPIYAGLTWFYPRLVRGGYIFVHDCCNAEYKGARQALLDFSQKHQVGYVILPDEHGTAVITK